MISQETLLCLPQRRKNRCSHISREILQFALCVKAAASHLQICLGGLGALGNRQHSIVRDIIKLRGHLPERKVLERSPLTRHRRKLHGELCEMSQPLNTPRKMGSSQREGGCPQARGSPWSWAAAGGGAGRTGQDTLQPPGPRRRSPPPLRPGPRGMTMLTESQRDGQAR